jgi:hypothetical protein
MTQNVQPSSQAASQTTLSASSSSNLFGQSATFTATVSAVVPGARTPTGSMTFLVDGKGVGTQPLNGLGTASITLGNLSGGAHSVVASYSGDSTFSGSQSSALAHSVSVPTTTAFSSPPSTASFGQSVSYTVTVTGADGLVPAGQVTLFVDFSAAGVMTLNSGGQATFTLSNLNAGSHVLGASYAGNGTDLYSATGALTQQVNPAPTTLTIVSSAQSAILGNPISYTVTVASPSSGMVPSGPVTLFIDFTPQGTLMLNSAGQATFTITNPTLFFQGAHTFAASYAGNNNFLYSASPPQTQLVGLPTRTTITSASPTASLGAGVTFTASVQALDTSGNVIANPLLTGFVVFYVGTTAQLNAAGQFFTPINGAGQAQITLTNLPLGASNVWAVYTLDLNFTASTSNIFTENVTPLATALSLTSSSALDSSGNPTSSSGDAVTFTATLSAAPSSVPLAGTVSFQINGAAVPGGPLSISGPGSVSITVDPSLLPVGNDSVTAIFTPLNGNFLGSSGGLSQVVVQSGGGRRQ